MAEDCRPSDIAVVALSLRDEKLFMRTWEPDPEHDADQPFATFSPEYAGRAVVAMAADPQVMQKSGYVPFLEGPALAWEYGFTDVDGRQP